MAIHINLSPRRLVQSFLPLQPPALRPNSTLPLLPVTYATTTVQANQYRPPHNSHQFDYFTQPWHPPLRQFVPCPGGALQPPQAFQLSRNRFGPPFLPSCPTPNPHL
ncbi:hypothetical protein M407DRAFT_246654 [Tulasnella calospora MUT 4182]|uniref:Uncharacterized protein n=1 Tax=Tulasnella calospora MUT 4182 TaxID=1051891 RepID=A0A0C3K8I2_9AGAM|nr:hypothetical protein M407DRAFT_246654 [Tulasnella calospora MUT 4182]